MIRFARTAMIATALALSLGGCVNFDPQDWFAGDWFGNKKPLPGQRRELFPGGVPGVSRGVPSDLVKGNQAAALQEQEAEEPKVILAEEPKAAPKPKAKPKPKPKPKVVEDTSEPDRRPTPVTVRPQSPPPAQRPQQVQWPDPPGTQRPQQQPSIWPDPPAPR
jgi:outer membrane biosynthesis protein TonB